jgi:hypothetical protein
MPARKGRGAGLLVGLAIAAVMGIALVALGGWYLFGRRAATPEPPPAPDVARATEAPLPAEAASPTPGAAGPAEAVPAPATAKATAPGAVTESQPAARVASRAAPPAPPAQVPPVPAPPDTGPGPGAKGAAPGGDYAFLDEAPTEAPDGRATGEALAQKYRAGGSSSYSTTRFPARPRWPRGLTRAEGPAVRTLLHIHSAEEAYHRKTGRYGNLREMAGTSGFGLDVPFSAEGFERARYGFHVTVEGDGYRALAAPLAPIGRAFLVDDSGFVRLRDE